MKKLALISLPVLVSGLLSGCGGEELFNEPAADFESCVVGSWSREGDLPDYQYAQNYTFFSDGTMRYDSRTEIPLWIRTAAVLEGSVDSDEVYRYGIQLRTGAWKYQDGIFYIATQHSQNATGDSESEILEYLDETTPSGVPMESSPSGTEYYGYTTHCDEEFLKNGVYKKASENPLVYQNDSSSKSPYDDSNSPREETYTLFSNGTGEYKWNARSPQEPRNLEYNYEGNVMLMDIESCGSCSTYSREFIDYGHTLVPFTNSYFVRQ